MSSPADGEPEKLSPELQSKIKAESRATSLFLVWVPSFLRELSRRQVFLACGVVIAIIIGSLFLSYYIQSRQQAQVPSVPLEKKTILLILLDVSESVRTEQLQQLVGYTESILDDVAPGTDFRIFSFGDRVESKPIADGITKEIPHGPDEGTDFQNRKLALYRSIEEAVAQAHKRVSPSLSSTCIISALSFAQHYFSQFTANAQHFELVILSDMKENCSEDSLNRKIILDQPNISNELQALDALPSFPDLSSVNLTMILPSAISSQRDVREEELDRFWRKALTKFGFTNEMLNDNRHFFFTTVYPERFKAMKSKR